MDILGFWDITNNRIYENVDVVDVVGYSGIYIYNIYIVNDTICVVEEKWRDPKMNNSIFEWGREC
jgi:hypothetical protein